MMKTNNKAMEKDKKMNMLKIIAMSVAAIGALVVGVPIMQQDQANKGMEADVAVMDKVVNTIEIAMTNQDIYDEVLTYSVENKTVSGSQTDEKGITITFESKIENGKFICSPPEAAVNKSLGQITQLRQLSKLNNYLQQNIGDEIVIQYYTDSDYTVHIKMGETKNDVVVYGEFDTVETKNQ